MAGVRKGGFSSFRSRLNLQVRPCVHHRTLEPPGVPGWGSQQTPTARVCFLPVLVSKKSDVHFLQAVPRREHPSAREAVASNSTGETGCSPEGQVPRIPRGPCSSTMKCQTFLGTNQMAERQRLVSSEGWTVTVPRGLLPAPLGPSLSIVTNKERGVGLGRKREGL